ncbi:hypothetical protein WG66_016337 [Moniliophthora roreri]|uniref:Uncharacterized protein n=1 Tax=Moniliophthora roreri TaxID=221103 RepID=A0A0W0FC28_MONRR|nr:hypothetical protein WG66_016337 [Moniliophthora roreri]
MVVPEEYGNLTDPGAARLEEGKELRRNHVRTFQGIELDAGTVIYAANALVRNRKSVGKRVAAISDYFRELFRFRKLGEGPPSQSTSEPKTRHVRPSEKGNTVVLDRSCRMNYFHHTAPFSQTQGLVSPLDTLHGVDALFKLYQRLTRSEGGGTRREEELSHLSTQITRYFNWSISCSTVQRQ